MANDNLLIVADTIFAEVTKNPKQFDKDVTGLASIIRNRTFQKDNLNEILSIDAFPGVQTKEFAKARTKSFTPEEEDKYKRILQLSSGIMRGLIKDPTNGATRFTKKKKTKGFKSGAKTFITEEVQDESGKL